MNEGMEGWVEEWMNELIKGWMTELMSGRMNGKLNYWIYKWNDE